MQTLTCSTCGSEWSRPPQRGRPPKQCPDCKAGRKPEKNPAPVARMMTPTAAKNLSEPPDDPVRPPVKRKRKTAYGQMHAGADHGPLLDLPLASRTSGWCTTYDPSPVAVHDRCDGDLGKYRCPCSCHGWV